MRSLAANVLANELKKTIYPNTILYISASKFCVFGEMSKIANVKIIHQPEANKNSEKDTIIGDPFDVLDVIDETFDFIVGDLPFGSLKKEMKKGSFSIKVRKNWVTIFKALFKLTENGYGLFLVEPAIWSQEWKKFSKALADSGYYINAIFNAPENILRPETYIRPIIILASKKKRDKLFIAEMTDDGGLASIIQNFRDNKTSPYIEDGVFIDEVDFKGFENYKITKQIEKLQTQYKDFKEYRLTDIAKEIKLGKQNKIFKEVNNSVYVPKVGNSPVVSDLNKAKLKHHNYFQVTLDSSIVINEYASLFFSSELGRLILDSLYVGVTIPNITRDSLERAVIAIPSKKEQRTIISTSQKLDKLEISIEDFKKELSLNPKSATTIQDKVDSMLIDLNVLSDADRIRSIIRKGESKTLEFKQTLSLEIKNRKKAKYLEKASLKTIVALLNTDGGILLIGVDDYGNLKGLDEEISKFHKNTDKFLLNVKNLIKNAIGEDFYPFINYRIVNIDDVKILFVECKASTDPCFFEGKEFFVRTNPATDRLDGPKLVEYIKRHFGN